jgi:hypothetical protein
VDPVRPVALVACKGQQRQQQQRNVMLFISLSTCMLMQVSSQNTLLHIFLAESLNAPHHITGMRECCIRSAVESCIWFGIGLRCDNGYLSSHT